MTRVEYVTFADWLLEACDHADEVDDGIVRVDKSRRVDPATGAWTLYLHGVFWRRGLPHCARERVEDGLPYDTERYNEAGKLLAHSVNDAYRSMEVLGLKVRRGFVEF